MKIKRHAVVFFWLSMLAVGQSPVPVVKRSSAQINIQRTQERFEARRQNFDSGRQLLVDKGVPFDPDDLLHDDWKTRLKSALESMPEMQATRYETKPLKGAYLADTLYLPEKVQLSGHTVIVVNYLVFEGNNAVIKGPYDLQIFPAKPVTVLGSSLAQLLKKNPELLRVSFAGKQTLPSFRLLQDVVQQERHHIVFDTSGLEPEWMRKPAKRLGAGLRAVAIWPGAGMLQSGNQNVSGNTGATGQTGAFGSPGTAGASPPKSPNGQCSASFNGIGGTPGGDGTEGGNGRNGLTGGQGDNAGNINISVDDGDTNAYDYIANGGNGGQGGVGGNGGAGGDGGRGGDGGDGVACGCQVGDGGNAGHGGNGGNGGNAGNGGNGGNGGAGGTITVSLPWNSRGPGTVSNRGGSGGPSGVGGVGGRGGNPANPGNPGLAASACGVKGVNGDDNFPGSAGSPGQSGDGGTTNGQNGPSGPGPSISFRPNPNTGGDPTGCGNVGGGGFTPTDGGAGGDGCSPIIIDTEREGFHLTSALNGVAFDISGTGHSVQMAWTDAQFHNAFLALPGSDGLVHNGKELFGNFTPQPQSAHPNGFLALAQFDKPENGGNGDGMIDERDQVYSRLRLWIDENHDGICQPNELYRLPELGVYSLALKYTESRRKDEFGNQFRYKAVVNPGERRDARDQTPSGEPGRWMYDVFFVIK